MWPAPQLQTLHSPRLVLNATGLIFTTNSSSTVLGMAIKRYRAVIRDHTALLPRPGRGQESLQALNDSGLWLRLSTLRITIMSTNESLALNISERYQLRLTGENGALVADTVWGALRGLETLSQLVTQRDDGGVIAQTILDWPRFPYRGVMVDSARHFLPVALLEAHIDALAYSKMNRFHWHLTDTCAFPYESKRFPNLSDAGAYDSAHVYSPGDVAHLVEYGRLRGVVLVPEFDVSHFRRPARPPHAAL